MIDYIEIKYDTDTWELFARDFLSELGFYIESPPDRGADSGKDLIITETIKGKIHQSKFRWLVSCKHFAHSNKSVNEREHEKNILERLKDFNADGFLGFYSTLPSSGLNSRLNSLKKSKTIKDYDIFDGKKIENYLVTEGYSHLLMRYFPESYKNVKPLVLVLDSYKPLLCESCGKDLLKELYKPGFRGANIIYVYKRMDISNRENFYPRLCEEVYCCCKKCDNILRVEKLDSGFSTTWEDISDIIIPVQFLNYFFAVMNRIRDGKHTFTDQAYNQFQEIIIALSQKTLRATTEKERARFNSLMNFVPY